MGRLGLTRQLDRQVRSFATFGAIGFRRKGILDDAEVARTIEKAVG